MRSYAEPIIAHPDPVPHAFYQHHAAGSIRTADARTADARTVDARTVDARTADARTAGATGDPASAGPPQAFLWRGRHYAVRSVVATWLDHAPWWRGADQPVRRCWRVEASAGMASGSSIVDLTCAADGSWQLLAVLD